MKVGIFYNKNYLSDNLAYIERIQFKFMENGDECKIVNGVEDLKGIEVLFVLGGDGTILNIAAYCAELNVKIIGINYGHVGFLAEFEREKLDMAIDLVCSGNYKTVKRSILKITSGKNSYYALNDFVMQRSTSGRLYSNTVSLQCEINGSTVDNLSSDGLIISTPTGSTAYSLSAGGSILAPGIKAFIMTPICPHSLHSRPIVFSDKSVVKIKPLSKGTSINLVVDGKVVENISDNKIITVKRAKRMATFITVDNDDFFNKLLFKLNKWGR